MGETYLIPVDSRQYGVYRFDMAVKTTTGGDLLRQWRESGLMTQVEAGAKLGINPQQISRYECGRVVPGFYIARKLLDECGIPPGLWISNKGRTL